MAIRLLTFLSKYKYHFLAWAIFNAYEITLLYIIRGKQSYTGLIFPIALNIILFYFHANVLLKYTMNARNKVLKFSMIFLVLLEFLFFVTLKYTGTKIIYKYIDNRPLTQYDIDKNTPGSLTWRAIYFMGYSTGYYLLIRSQQRRKLVEKMKKQELKKILSEKEIKNELILTQNALLRAQINPIF